MRRLLNLCIKLAIAVSASWSSVSHAQYVTIPSGPHELNFPNCVVPYALTFAREYESNGWITNRYVQPVSGGPFYKFTHSATPPYPKNPEGIGTHAPGQLSNCSYISGTSTPRSSVASKVHTLTFRFAGYGLFNNGIAGHVVALQRAYFPNNYAQGTRDGIGVATFASGSSDSRTIFAQRPNNMLAPEYYESQDTSGYGFRLRDGEIYQVLMRANSTEITFQVDNLSFPSETFWRTYTVQHTVPAVNGVGFAFALLCQDANAACEGFNQNWKIEFWDVTAGEI